jgi:hypothetical protein
MRTVWLALFCLIALATTVLVKIISPYATADVSRDVPFAKLEVPRDTSLTDTVALSSESVTTGTKLQNDPSTKADKIEVSYTNEAAPETKSVKSVSIVLPATEPKRLSTKKTERIVIRHWHDPSDKRGVPAAKRKVSNTKRSQVVTARTKVVIPGKGAPIRF